MNINIIKITKITIYSNFLYISPCKKYSFDL